MVVKPKGQVLRLKVIAALYGLSTRQIAAGCDVKMHRNFISNIWNLVNSVKPERQESIKRFLVSEGIPEELASRAFEEVDEAEETAKLKNGSTLEPVEINPDEKIETKGAVMLRRQVRAQFGLTRDPFQPRAEDQPFKSKAFQNCLDLVWDAIEVQAFLALSGPTGCGKSVLWVHLRQQLLNQKGVRIAAVRRFDKKRISERDIYFSLLEDLSEEKQSMGRGNEQAIRRVEDLLAESARENITTVILLNEAHDLAADGFVLLKRLWEMFDNRPEMGFARSCAVIMLGQEGLAATLNSTRPELREVCQRADVEDYGLLQANEVGPYLQHRMGADCDRIFDESAIEFFSTRRLRLTPQILNVMATRSINEAFQVGAERVTAEHASSLLR